MNQKKTRKYKQKNKPQNQTNNLAQNNQRPNRLKKRKPNPQRSKAIREYTAGGIVYRHNKGELEILLLQDTKNRWSIPKGHVESGETLEQTALRESIEETGLKNLILKEKLDKIHFFYRMNGRLIFMTTFIFMIESTDLSEEAKTEEDAPWITDAQWFSADQACEILEYKATKVILQEAIRRLERKQFESNV